MGRKKILNIFLIALVITVFGFLMDDDIKEPSTVMRFVEFFAMIGILFTILFLVNEFVNLIKKRINLSSN